MKTVLPLILAFFLLWQVSCRKDEPSPPAEPGPDYSISPECKAWTMFQPGSYWLYMNETTHQADCTSYKHGLYFFRTNYTNGGVQESNWYYVTSPNFVKFTLVGGKGGNRLKIRLPDAQQLIGLTQKSIADSVTSDSVPDYYTYTLVEKFPALLLNGIKFTHVIHTRCRYQNKNTSVYDFYWVRNIGLVSYRKSHDSHDTTWSLKRWKVVQ